eukprot:TRINITY_DN2232_c0_g1_i1.p1 TRINITY_DN2232_c0_g1~~TRINITY_DN2232_c0_g1_i1.p1  ORF type:complete len:1369 (+),score=328.39 TRINITY_DN2232_c0_g1_i1:764-4870(+)
MNWTCECATGYVCIAGCAVHTAHVCHIITSAPSVTPSAGPTVPPTMTPSAGPSTSPSASPSRSPSLPPTASPSLSPSLTPTASPSYSPSAMPSRTPSTPPSAAPSASPSAQPSRGPSASPSAAPSRAPSTPPTVTPSRAPSTSPTWQPSQPPSAMPSAGPSASPSVTPSVGPSQMPSVSPSAPPTATPSSAPSSPPSPAPSAVPSTTPSVSPSLSPQLSPTGSPSASPIKFPRFTFSPTLPPRPSPLTFSPSAPPVQAPPVITLPPLPPLTLPPVRTLPPVVPFTWAPTQAYCNPCSSCGSKDACLVNPTCGYGSVCEPCAGKTDTTSCMGLSGCGWGAGATCGACSPKSSREDCLIAACGFNALGQCGPTECDTVLASTVSCAATGCGWDGTGGCKTCGIIGNAMDCKTSGCGWDASRGLCVSCQAFSPKPALCLASGCSWDVSGASPVGGCMPCSSLTDKKTCGSAGCGFSVGGTCVACSTVTNPVDCVADGCFWNAASGGCEGRSTETCVTVGVGATSCSAEGCAWHANGRCTSCSEQTDPKGCAEAGCFMNSRGICTPPSCDAATGLQQGPDTCAHDGGCGWSAASGTCQRCGLSSDSVDCAAHGCGWSVSAGACYACSAELHHGDCAQAGCVWSSARGGCVPPLCHAVNAGERETCLEEGCGWSPGGGCISCGTKATNADCIDSGCGWDSGSGRCIACSGGFPNQADCTAAGCVFVLTGPYTGCMPPLQGTFTPLTPAPALAPPPTFVPSTPAPPNPVPATFVPQTPAPVIAHGTFVPPTPIPAAVAPGDTAGHLGAAEGEDVNEDKGFPWWIIIVLATLCCLLAALLAYCRRKKRIDKLDFHTGTVEKVARRDSDDEMALLRDEDELDVSLRSRLRRSLQRTSTQQEGGLDTPLVEVTDDAEWDELESSSPSDSGSRRRKVRDMKPGQSVSFEHDIDDPDERRRKQRSAPRHVKGSSRRGRPRGPTGTWSAPPAPHQWVPQPDEPTAALDSVFQRRVSGGGWVPDADEPSAAKDLSKTMPPGVRRHDSLHPGIRTARSVVTPGSATALRRRKSEAGLLLRQNRPRTSTQVAPGLTSDRDADSPDTPYLRRRRRMDPPEQKLEQSSSPSPTSRSQKPLETLEEDKHSLSSDHEAESPPPSAAKRLPPRASRVQRQQPGRRGTSLLDALAASRNVMESSTLGQRRPSAELSEGDDASGEDIEPLAASQSFRPPEVRSPLVTAASSAALKRRQSMGIGLRKPSTPAAAVAPPAGAPSPPSRQRLARTINFGKRSPLSGLSGPGLVATQSSGHLLRKSSRVQRAAPETPSSPGTSRRASMFPRHLTEGSPRAEKTDDQDEPSAAAAEEPPTAAAAEAPAQAEDVES